MTEPIDLDLDLTAMLDDAAEAPQSAPLDVVIGKLEGVRYALNEASDPRVGKVTRFIEQLYFMLETLDNIEIDFMAMFGREPGDF
jgi:hypothetical protein